MKELYNIRLIEEALAGTTKTAFAAAAGISRPALDRVLNGADSKISTLHGIAAAAGFKVYDLFACCPQKRGARRKAAKS